MKKITLTAVALAAITAAQAQLPKLGIKGGLNIANISAEGSSNNTLLSGHGGLIVHAHLAPAWALQPEVLYSGQGAKQTIGGTEYTVNLNYLNVPIMVQYMFSNGFRVEAGPQVGLLLSGKVKNSAGSTDIKSTLSQVDFGVGVGLNYLTYSGFGVGGRYNFGLSNINKDENAGNAKNRVAQISLFYLFNNNHKANSR